MLAKSKLNRIKVLISKGLIDPDINHDKFAFEKKCAEIIWWYERKN